MTVSAVHIRLASGTLTAPCWFRPRSLQARPILSSITSGSVQSLTENPTLAPGNYVIGGQSTFDDYTAIGLNSVKGQPLIIAPGHILGRKSDK